MTKVKHMYIGTDVYKRIQELQMSETDRQAALRAIRDAEAIVDALLWVKSRLVAVGTYFLKPSLKH